jgi:agmatinase
MKAPEFYRPPINFMGSETCSLKETADYDAVIFSAPHGTAYEGIDYSLHAETGNALRLALKDDSDWTDHWDFDFGGTLLGDGALRLGDLGILKTSPQQGKTNRHMIRETARAISKVGAIPLMIGGDDSVPIPFIEGLAAGGPLTVVQIDAHIDWRDKRRGERFGFSSTMRRASEMPHVENIIQIGIRGLGSARREEVEFAQNWGAQIVTAERLHREGIGEVVDMVPAGSRCLITLDCDALDASIMPAVISPTPGGLTYQQVIGIIAGVISRADLVGFDLIEFVPKRDHNGVSAFTAARIVCNVIGNLARVRRTLA